MKHTSKKAWLSGLLLAGSFAFQPATAQKAANYNFQSSSGSFTSIAHTSGATQVARARATSGTGASMDDTVMTLASSTLPFTFTIDSVGYTGLNISANGYITFGSTAPATSNYSPLSSSAGYAAAISAFGRDLNGLFTSTDTGQIWYTTVGSSPNREFVIEWKNVKDYSTSTSNILKLSFQIRLKEDNSIRIVYDYGKVGTPTGNITGQVGLRGPNNTFSTNVNNRMIVSGENSWSNSYPATSNSSTMLMPVSGSFPGGITYTWTVPSACSGTPSVEAIMGKNVACGTSINIYNNTANNYAYGMTYSWQVSSNGTNFSDVSTGTVGKGTYSLSSFSLPIYFRVKALCANSNDSGFSSVFAVNSGDTTNLKWAELPYANTFDNSWLDGDCYPGEKPDSNWINYPRTGNASWRRSDQGTSHGGWSSNSGSYSPAGAASTSYSARFHTWNVTAGQSGAMYLHFDASTLSGSKQLNFYYINTSGYDSMYIFLSTDSGSTYGNAIAGYGVSTSWDLKTVVLGNLSGKCVLQFRAFSDYGSTDIGIDQIEIDEVPSLDLKVLGFTSPGSECIGDSVTVKVLLRNEASGTLNLANDTALLSTWVNGTLYHNHLNSGTLDSGDSLEVTVTTGHQTPTAGTYTFAARINLPGDGSNSNDSVYTTLTKDSVYSIPYLQEFNASGPSNWAFDRFSYNAGYGVGGGGAYRSNVYGGYSGLAVSPVIGTIASGSYLRFEYVMRDYSGGGATTLDDGDTLFVLISDDCGNTATTIHTIHKGNHTPSTAYTTVELPLGSFAGSKVRVYLYGYHPGSSTSGTDYYLGIDNFEIFNKPNVDLELDAILSPSAFDCQSNGVDAEVRIRNAGLQSRNLGTDPIYVTLQVSGAASYTLHDTIDNGTLAAGNTLDYTFNSTLNLNASGLYTVRAWLSASGDANQANDTADDVSLERITSSALPFTQGFENLSSLTNWLVEQVSGNGNWTVRTTAMSNPTLSAYAGSNFLYFNSYNFSSGTASRAISPCLNLTNSDYPILEFYLSQSSAYTSAYDSLFIQYSLDGGSTWNTAGGFSRLDPNASTPFWKKFSVCLPQIANKDEVRIALLGVSDYGDNFGVDNVTLRNMDLGVAMATVGDTLCAGAPDSLLVVGMESAKSYQILDGSTVLATLNGSISNFGVVALNLSAGVHELTILVTDSLSSCSDYAHDTLTLVVLAPASVSLGTDQALCDGDSTELTPGPGFLSYFWSTAENTQSIWVQDSGTYTVTVTDSMGCENRDEVVISLNSLPQPDLGNDTGVCARDGVVLTPGSFASYSWTGGQQTATLMVTSSGTYTVTVTDANGCEASDEVDITVFTDPTVQISDQEVCADSVAYYDAGPGFSSYLWLPGGDTTRYIIRTVSTPVVLLVYDNNGCYATDSAYVTVNPLPLVNLGADTLVCDGSAVTLDAGLFDEYDWSTGADSQSIVVQTSGTYTVQVTDGNGCRETDDINVTINNPQVDLGQDQEVCEGTPLSFDAGAGFASYEWSTTETTQSINVTQTNTYWVSVSDSDGCIATDTVEATIHSLPQVDLGPDTAFCDGHELTLSNRVATSGNYLWSNGDSTGTIEVNAAGTYWLNVVDGNQCSATDSIEVDVNALPDASFSYTDNGGNQIAFNASDTLKFFLWAFGDGDTSTQDDPTHQYGSQGSFTAALYVADSNGCVDSSFQSIVLTHLASVLPALDIRIYPNPSHGVLYLETDLDVDGTVAVVLYDALGKEVKAYSYSGHSGTQVEPLNLELLSPGTYILKVQSNGRQSSFRVVITR